jgi:hypothetical protein
MSLVVRHCYETWLSRLRIDSLSQFTTVECWRQPKVAVFSSNESLLLMIGVKCSPFASNGKLAESSDKSELGNLCVRRFTQTFRG